GSYSTSATALGTTADPDATNNTSTATFDIQTGVSNAACELTCPSNFTVNADTTEGGQRGAHVTFPDTAGTGSCGTITPSPVSGSFFPVGTTVVTVTSATGDGSCTFAITVVEASGNVSISCPANLLGNANADCEASFNLGTPTTTGDNVTITASRSDGKPMYDCDVNGNCVRKTTDLPFSSGTTTVTWTAYSHDTAGPYASPDDEVTHRTGNASCNQLVVVRDVTPPVITATDQTVSTDANCQAAVPDYSNAVTDNCSCAANDNSQDCVNQHQISVTQDVAPGTLLGPGTYTIHLTANDGASDPGPDGIPQTADDGTGNVSTKTTTLTVADTTPPVFTGTPLASVTAYTGAGATTCDAVVNLPTPATSDNCSAVIVTRSPSGNTFPVGTTTVTWTATDAAGNHSTATQTVTVIDNTPPVISCPANITVYLPLHTSATSMNVSYPAATATDNCGTPSIGYSIASGSVFNVGTTPVTATATDAAGNTASCTFTVTVLYDFTGFFAPVNNPPTLNVVQSGRAIPVKFSLSGNKGLGIFAANSPQVGVIACDGSAPVADLTDTVTAGGSSLSYDAGSDQYIYVWKTDSSWAGSCRQLVVTLNDGSVHVANFKFK
ncbi:MAG TPA: PxKF domain-containing protein, partial [Pyrinomonadaceae bacterium]|nr:PxKF domain-containing protein [Pyrinomonadaceae bacterium]